MGLTNLGLMPELATAAARRAIAQPTKPATVKKANATRTRLNGSKENAEKGAAMAKAQAKAKGKERQNKVEAGIGKVKALSYLAPTTTKETATANSVIIAASRMKGRKVESANKLPWP